MAAEEKKKAEINLKDDTTIEKPVIPVEVMTAYEADELDYGRLMFAFLSYIDKCWSFLGARRRRFFAFLYDDVKGRKRKSSRCTRRRNKRRRKRETPPIPLIHNRTW